MDCSVRLRSFNTDLDYSRYQIERKNKRCSQKESDADEILQSVGCIQLFVFEKIAQLDFCSSGNIQGKTESGCRVNVIREGFNFPIMNESQFKVYLNNTYFIITKLVSMEL